MAPVGLEAREGPAALLVRSLLALQPIHRVAQALVVADHGCSALGEVDEEITKAESSIQQLEVSGIRVLLPVGLQVRFCNGWKLLAQISVLLVERDLQRPGVVLRKAKLFANREIVQQWTETVILDPLAFEMVQEGDGLHVECAIRPAGRRQIG